MAPKVKYYSNKTKEGLTETQVLAMDAKKKALGKKKPKTHDMFGNKIFDHGQMKPSAFEK